jgi:N-carbamoyl-L-amino-acid hydrolase
VIRAIEGICAEHGVPAKSMASRTGHDTQYFATFTDVGMIFIPCRDGVSHAPEEFADVDDICLGAEILAYTLTRLGGRANG